MSETVTSKKPMPEEQTTEARRKLLKILAAGGGAVAASTVLPGSWLAPVANIGVLPAHAQTSRTTTDYFVVQVVQTVPDASLPPTAAPANPGPSAIQVTVDFVTEIAHVVANNRNNFYRHSIDLEIDGTPSNAFTVVATTCPLNGSGLPGAKWNVEGYTLGDPTIKIASTEGEGSGWVVEVPMGTGILPDLDPCD
jgi:hypothetical protein